MTTMLAADPNERVHMRQQALQQRVLLLAPTFGCWRGYYQLSEDSVGITVDNQIVESEDVTTPRSVLMKDDCPLDRHGKAWKKRFRDIENVMSKLISQYSVPFPIRGVRIVPKSRGGSFFDALIGPTAADGTPLAKRQNSVPLAIEDQAVAYQLALAANEFCADLAGIYRQIEGKINARIWLAIQERLPETPLKMREKFYVDATPIELAGNVHSEVNLEELRTHETVVQDACRRKVEEAIEAMVAGPRVELAKTLADLQALIARDGRVTSKSFAPVRAKIAKIRLFDFVANESLLEQIDSLEQRLDITVPTHLDSVTAANSGFMAALQSVQEEITNATQQSEDMEQFGRALRGIDLD